MAGLGENVGCCSSGKEHVQSSEGCMQETEGKSLCLVSKARGRGRTVPAGGLRA